MSQFMEERKFYSKHNSKILKIFSQGNGMTEYTFWRDLSKRNGKIVFEGISTWTSNLNRWKSCLKMGIIFMVSSMAKDRYHLKQLETLARDMYHQEFQNQKKKKKRVSKSDMVIVKRVLSENSLSVLGIQRSTDSVRNRAAVLCILQNILFS